MFSSLFAGACTPNKMLNKSGESEHPCLIPDLGGNVFSFSPTEYNVNWGFVIYAFYYVEVCSLFAHFLQLLSLIHVEYYQKLSLHILR